MSSLQGSEARLGNEESIFGGVDPFIMLDSFKEGQGRDLDAATSRLLTGFLQTDQEIVGYIGCYTFVPTGNTVLVPATSQTIEGCIEACRQSSQPYFAGMTNGGTCYCTGDISRAVLAGETSCNIPCPGNNTEYCGGNGYFSFSMLDPKANTNVGKQGYLGCYTEGPALPDAKNNVNSIAECISECSSYLYAGVSFGTQCFCGNQIPTNRFPDVVCTGGNIYSCASGESCGFSLIWSVFEVNSVEVNSVDPWYLARATEAGSFVANFTGTSTPPIEMYYKVFHDKIPDVVISLLEYDCTTPLIDGSLSVDPTFTGLDANPPSSIVVPHDISIFKLGIDVDGSKLYKSPVWMSSNPANTAGAIDFCVRADLYLDPTTKKTSVSFKRTKISLEATMSENFTLATLQATAVVDESTNQTASAAYQMIACQCDSSNVCISPDTPVVADSALRICVAPQSSTVVIASVTSLQLNQGGVPVTFPISNGADDPLTTTALGVTIVPSLGSPLVPGGAVIDTRLVSAFFQSPNPANIQVTGSVLLKFANGGRSLGYMEMLPATGEEDMMNPEASLRSLQGTTGTAPTAGFSVDVPVEATTSSSSSMDVGVVVGSVIAGLAVVALVVAFVAVRRRRMNGASENLQPMKENDEVGYLDEETEAKDASSSEGKE